MGNFYEVIQTTPDVSASELSDFQSDHKFLCAFLKNPESSVERNLLFAMPHLQAAGHSGKTNIYLIVPDPAVRKAARGQMRRLATSPAGSPDSWTDRTWSCRVAAHRPASDSVLGANRGGRKVLCNYTVYISCSSAMFNKDLHRAYLPSLFTAVSGAK